nr:MAG TPA: hypothetical protein [Caudoviricetes sp.]
MNYLINTCYISRFTNVAGILFKIKNRDVHKLIIYHIIGIYNSINGIIKI